MIRSILFFAAWFSCSAALPSHLTAATPQGSGPTVRWEIDDQAEAWIGECIALGDQGSVLIAGKTLSGGSQVAVHSTASASSILEFPIPDARYIQVAAAKAGRTLAAVTARELGSGSQLDVQPTLHVWQSAHADGPDWKLDFPLTQSYGSVGVQISADGQRIVTWSSNGNLSLVDLRVFDRDGNELLQVDLPAPNGGEARGYEGVITPQASHFLLTIDGSPLLVDLTHGQIMQIWNRRSKRGGLAISADGQTVGIGDLNSVKVYRENLLGNFDLRHSYPLSGKRIGGPLALDSDGSHLAYSVNWDQNSEKAQIRVQDLGPDVELWRQEVAAPGNQKSLWISKLLMEEDAKVVVASSWGDDSRVTPTGFVFDQIGTILSFIRTEGSALDMDYDPAAELVVYSTKDTHVSGFGPYGGDIICADARPTELLVSGLPQAGAIMELTLRGNGTHARLAVASSLGASSTPFGVSQLDFSTLLVILPPIPLAGGGTTIQLNAPGSAAFIGSPLHLQAAIIDTANGSGYLSNRVSIRVLP
jgi:hypothetical protein